MVSVKIQRKSLLKRSIRLQAFDLAKILIKYICNKKKKLKEDVLVVRQVVSMYVNHYKIFVIFMQLRGKFSKRLHHPKNFYSRGTSVSHSTFFPNSHNGTPYVTRKILLFSNFFPYNKKYGFLQIEIYKVRQKLDICNMSCILLNEH